MKSTDKQARAYRSAIAAVVHEGVAGLHRAGLADEQTMRDFDLRCLTLVEPLTGPGVVALRGRDGVSLAVFARSKSG